MYLHPVNSNPSSRSAKWKLLRKWSSLFITFSAIGLAMILSSSCTCSRKTQSENTINFPLAANVKGLDPIFGSDEYTNDVMGSIYDTLYQYHYLKRPLQLEPFLAESMPEVSADGLTHTIKIKKGVKFHDSEVFPEGKGRELVAEDFIYSFKRLADPNNQSEGFWVFDHKIVGFNEWREKAAGGKADYSAPIEGLSAPDSHTLVIKLKRPYYQLHHVLAMTYSAPIPKEAIDKYGKEFLNHPVGTGPFMFEKWTRNSKIELKKNPTWYGGKYPSEGQPGDEEKGLLKDAGQALPFADKLVFHEVVEDSPRWQQFMKGEFDFSGIPKDNYDSAIEKGELKADLVQKKIQLQKSVELDLTYTAFNMLDPILGKNVNLRRALSMATDTPGLLEKFYNNRANAAQSPIPPEVDAYDPEFRNPYVEYNVEKAKEYLAKAGYPEGKGLPELTFSTVMAATGRQVAEFYKQNMEAIGVKINIKVLSWPQFAQEIREKKAQIWSIAWNADYPDAENFLQLLYGPNASPGPNGANFNNAEFNKLYDQAALLPSGEQRTALYKKMRDIFVEEMPWTPNANRVNFVVYHGWVKNFKRHKLVKGSPRYWRLDLEEKQALKAKL